MREHAALWCDVDSSSVIFQFEEFLDTDFTSVGAITVEFLYLAVDKARIKSVFLAGPPLDVFGVPSPSQLIEVNAGNPIEGAAFEDPETMGGARKTKLEFFGGDLTLSADIGGGSLGFTSTGFGGLGTYRSIWDGSTTDPCEVEPGNMLVDMTQAGTVDRLAVVWNEVGTSAEVLTLDVQDVNGVVGSHQLAVPERAPAIQEFMFSDLSTSGPTLDLTQVTAVSISSPMIAGTAHRFAYIGPAPGGDPPTCLADCNGDGVLNILDFVCYQNLFSAGDPGADCDGNGVLNILDFVCFQNTFAVGC